MNGKHKFLLLAILILAALLRLYRITEVPPGVNRDEASIGYTAYSLLHTGKDEYGRSFPLSFESFGDWKLPFYIYITVPFVKVFGLNELSVRLPSALAGIATVFLTYFLVLELFLKLEIRNLKLPAIALFSALLLAISPWHLHLSRVESESNIAVFLIVAAILLFLKGVNGKRPALVAWSLPLFSLTYYTYHGNHVFTTLLLVGLCLFYHKKIPRTPTVIASMVVSLALITFVLSQTFLAADKTKLSGISIFGDPYVIHEKIELPRTQHANPNGLVARLTHNRLTFAIQTMGQNYIKAFSPEFLFIKGGGNAAHNIKNFGNMYVVEAPFFYLGIFVLLFFAFSKNSPVLVLNSKFLLLWFLISPIAASITKDAPHTNRMFAIFPLPPILIALGITWLLSLFRKQSFFRSLVLTTIILAYLANFAIYMDRYYVHFPKEEANNWGIGYKNLTTLLATDAYKEKQIVMTQPEASPYIFLLFYSNYDPATYQKQVLRYPPTDDAFVHVKGFGRFQFRDIKWSSDLATPDTILIEETKDVPEWVRTSPQAFTTISQWTLVDTGPRLQ